MLFHFNSQLHVLISSLSMSSLKVAVRVRPFNSREKENNSFNVIRMKGKSTGITNPRDKNDTGTFTFDYSYWSIEFSELQYAGQDMVQTDLGRDMLGHAFNGYNTCIFAYGDWFWENVHNVRNSRS